MAEHVQVVTTAATKQDAERIAHALVERRLAACAQVIGPIQSVYRWRGAIETAEEWQCWIKSRRELCTEIQRAIRELHSYEVPEILVLPVLDGDADYLAWLDEQVGRE
jgi:periplasmic divalent cation tolerance protein